MICSFDTYLDFKRVHPYLHGFTEDYICSLEHLQEADIEERDKLLNMMWNYHNEVDEQNTENSFDDSEVNGNDGEDS